MSTADTDLECVMQAASLFDRCSVMHRPSDGWADTTTVYPHQPRRWSGQLVCIGTTALDPALCASLASWMRTEAAGGSPSNPAISMARTLLGKPDPGMAWLVTCTIAGCTTLPSETVTTAAAATDVASMHSMFNHGHACFIGQVRV